MERTEHPEKLATLLKSWREWSVRANRSEDGWQSSFPQWAELISAAAQLMELGSLSEDELRMIESCWAMSEEDEDLADYARAHLASCWKTLEQLCRSKISDVRWQVYDVLGDAGTLGKALLLTALEDQDSYCRRRAILALARLNLAERAEIAARFINDSDPYIRQAAYQLAHPRET